MNYLSIFPSYEVNYALLRIAVPYFWIRACKIAVLYNISYLLLTFLLFFHQYEMNPETGDFTHKESRVSLDIFYFIFFKKTQNGLFQLYQQ